jgi:hypothetical protein
MRRFGTLVGLTLCWGCLELNPDYVDDAPANATGGDGASASASETGGDAETGGVPACPADPHEPNAFGTEAEVPEGLLSAVLNPMDDEDWYRVSADPGRPSAVHARAITGDVRVCLFLSCGDGSDPLIDKCSGDTASDPSGRPGCCGGSQAGAEYDCGGAFAIQAYVRVDTAASSCEPYELTIAIIDP